ncbi:MAG: tetratricopeptide repeat protein [Kofleriaceae bacterium]
MIRTWLVALAVATSLTACGGSATSRIGPNGKSSRVKLDPVNPKAAKEFEAAMRALRLGGPEASETARARLKAALEIDSKLWEAWHNLGVIAYREGEDEVAVEAYGKSLAIQPGHTPTLLGRAEANRRAGHKKAARTDYEAALRELEPDDVRRRDAAARLASLLRDFGDFDDAIAVLRDTVRLSGINAKIYTELGLIYMQQRKLDLAQLVFTKALELDAKDPAVYNALALLAQRQGKAQEAFERFEQAGTLDANYIDARFNKASVLLDAGDYARAKAELVAVVEKRPDDYAAQVALGVAYRGLKDFGEAKRTWDKVIKQAPKRSTSRADALFNVALLKVDFLQDVPGAKADLERYLQESPSSHAKRAAAEEKRKELGK